MCTHRGAPARAHARMHPRTHSRPPHTRPTPPFDPKAADVFALVATRLGAALFLSSIALAFLGAALPSTLYPLLAALLVLLAPAPPAARGFARMFRLNEALAEAAVAASAAAGVVSIAAAAAGAAAAGLLLAAGGGVEAAAGGAAAAAAAQGVGGRGVLACGPLHYRNRRQPHTRDIRYGMSRPLAPAPLPPPESHPNLQRRPPQTTPPACWRRRRCWRSRRRRSTTACAQIAR